MRVDRRGRQWQWRLVCACSACLGVPSCARTELNGAPPIRATGATAGFGMTATGGALVFVAGGASSVGSSDGGTGGSPAPATCPENVPVDGSRCGHQLTCAYVTADKGCCRETASARCRDGSWSVGHTDCDCTVVGGAPALGGSAATGGRVGSGGLTASAGRTGVAGAYGCRGDPIGYLARSCDLLVQADPALVRLDGVSPAESIGLAHATDDARCVSVVTTQSGPAGDTTGLAGISFEPWSNWPKSGAIGPLSTIALPDVPSGAFAVGPSVDHRIALVWQTEAGRALLSTDLDPETYVGSHRELTDASPAWVMNESEMGHALGVQLGLRQTIAVWSHDESAFASFRVACADTPTKLGIEPFRQGFIWASSNGSRNTEGGCPTTMTNPGPATRIEIGQILDYCCSERLWSFEFEGVVTELKTAPHPEGIWIVWQMDDASDRRRLRWMRVGQEPHIVLGPGSVGDDDRISAGFAVAAVGRKLAVAWRSDAARSRLALALIDETGRVQRDDPAVEVPQVGSLSMASGPAGAGVLVAFSEGSLMRLDCAEWE